ncbi:MAG: hypothetical protein LH473_11335 [Chitinophagales bacterium]|nr:hypothetical protein [Chitinophagales bacterium]
MKTKNNAQEPGINYGAIIKILGEEKIEKLHFIDSATFSIATMKNIIKEDKNSKLHKTRRAGSKDCDKNENFKNNDLPYK